MVSESVISPGDSSSLEDDGRRSSSQRLSPRMSHRALSILLSLMALVPPITIAVLWNIMPPVAEGKLDAKISAILLPDPAIYSMKFSERPEVTDGKLVVHNAGEEDWTHINIWVNGNYQIYDLDTLPAGKSREYDLDRFVTRSGATYDLRYNRLKKALIYARMPKGNRATREADLTPFSGGDQ